MRLEAARRHFDALSSESRLDLVYDKGGRQGVDWSRYQTGRRRVGHVAEEAADTAVAPSPSGAVLSPRYGGRVQVAMRNSPLAPQRWPPGRSGGAAGPGAVDTPRLDAPTVDAANATRGAAAHPSAHERLDDLLAAADAIGKPSWQKAWQTPQPSPRLKPSPRRQIVPVVPKALRYDKGKKSNPAYWEPDHMEHRPLPRVRVVER